MRPAASTQHAVLRVRAGRSVCRGFAPPGHTLQASVLHLRPARWPSRAAFAVFLERTHSLSHPPAPPSRMATSSWVQRPPLLLRSFFSAESRLVLLEPKSHRLSPHMETLRPSASPTRPAGCSVCRSPAAAPTSPPPQSPCLVISGRLGCVSALNTPARLPPPRALCSRVPSGTFHQCACHPGTTRAFVELSLSSGPGGRGSRPPSPVPGRFVSDAWRVPLAVPPFLLGCHRFRPKLSSLPSLE